MVAPAAPRRAAEADAPKKSKPSRGGGEGAPSTADASLSSDVAAFAAKLGLAAASAAPGAQGFDDADFRPEKASQKLGSGRRAAEPVRSGRGRGRGGDEGVAGRCSGRGSGSGSGSGSGRGRGRGSEGEGEPRQAPGRAWNAGAGPAPASLLARDAPALWHEAAAEAAAAAGLAVDARLPAGAEVDADALATARGDAGALLAAEADAAAASLTNSRDADARWLAKARAAGTAADKVAAAAVAAADAPAASLGALDDLLKAASKRGGGRGAAVAALDALTDLFAGPLLPTTRRLVPLAERPLDLLPTITPKRARDRLLLFWGLEDALRRRAGDHADALAAASRDSVDVVKRAGVRGLAARLSAAPEGEGAALAGLVNKLGDPDRRASSSASHALLGVLGTHPAMAPVVAGEVERAAFRPGQAPRARYAAILFLSALPLPRGPAGAALAESLVDAYFGLFRAVLDGKLGAAADAAAEAATADDAPGGKKKARARDGAKGAPRKKGKHGGGKYGRRAAEAKAPAVVQVGEEGRARGRGAAAAPTRRGRPAPPPPPPPLIPTVRRSARLRSGNLIAGRAPPGGAHQPAAARSRRRACARARGARARAARPAHNSRPLPPPHHPQAEGVDARILGALLTGVRRAAPFVPAPATDALLDKHGDALFRVAATAPFGTAVQALVLLFQLLDARVAASDRFHRALYARLADPAAPASSKAAQFLSLVYRACKTDTCPARLAACVKRLLQGALAAPAPFAAGCLLLVSELAAARPALWGMVSQPEEAGDGEDEGAGGEEGGGGDGAAPSPPPAAAPTPPSSTTPHHNPAAPTPPSSTTPHHNPAAPTAYPCGYDPAKREPRFARGDRAGLWELVPLAAHAHPSVAAFASSLLATTPIAYGGDPLKDFAPAAALDKFLARKPKKGAAARAAGARAAPFARPAATGRPHPGSAEFAALAAADVAPDEEYLHAWHAEKAARRAAATAGGASDPSPRKRRPDDDDAVAEASDSDDEAAAFVAAAEDGGAGGDAPADVDGGGDYGALATAMAEDAATRAFERGGEGEAECGSDEPGSGTEPDAGGSTSTSGSDAWAGGSKSGDDSEAEVDGLALDGVPSASGSSLADSDGDASDSSSDGSEWVMAPPAARRPAKRKAVRGGGDFADAEEYADLLDADAAGVNVDAAAEARVGGRRRRARR